MAEVEAARAAARVRFAHFAENDSDDEVGAVPGPVDTDNPPMTDVDLSRLRPAVEVAPGLVAASLRRRGGRIQPPATVAQTQPAAEPSTHATAGDAVQVYEERLDVGKRSLSRGKMRVRTSVVSREVSEGVTLHRETVSIDRRAVDRPVSAAALEDVDPFKERTIELEEFAEEAVVAKSAHVVEEIDIHKEAVDRVETVRETLRRTVVDIEDGRTGGAVAATERSATEIRDGMQVFGSDGVLVGRVARVDGDLIGLRAADAAAGGEHHYLTRAMVESVDDRVTLAMTADEAEVRWVTA